jgi:hypothetical protein
VIRVVTIRAGERVGQLERRLGEVRAYQEEAAPHLLGHLLFRVTLGEHARRIPAGTVALAEGKTHSTLKTP